MVTSGAMTRRMARSTRQKISNARRITVTRVSMRQLGRQTATDAEVIDWCAALAVPDVDEETLRAKVRNLWVQQLGWCRRLRADYDARNGRAPRLSVPPE